MTPFRFHETFDYFEHLKVVFKNTIKIDPRVVSRNSIAFSVLAKQSLPEETQLSTRTSKLVEKLGDLKNIFSHGISKQIILVFLSCSQISKSQLCQSLR